ncbi:zinc finger FYVE domain-containing protein 9-like [Centruroides sculpturatus]|uniref:zinc finger FYVE domain-containing protein 9-like n=1 Tax=Centruroides sculpturatus TaxID=218467 RepID=UPI000C6D8308|nr:zinc finger FYVE domain-containing protein 9-like [Centruroides sculpturatus]
MFSDGIRPGGDLTDQSEILDHPPPYRRQGRVQRRIEKTSTIDNSTQNSTIVSGKKHKASQLKSRIKKVIVTDSDGPLSPILLPPDLSSEGKPDLEKLINWLTDEQCRPIVFALTKNLHILAKIVKLDCCIGKECWCFTSNGLNTVGQDEVMVIIERLSNENTIPRDIFRFFSMLYDNASKGVTVGNLGHLLFPEGILGSREHSGFLFVRHTFQCLGKLVLPSAPFLIALLIQKWEVPWVKVFPLRLMLRLGAEFRYYPCPLISVRYRKPVYCEIGHTIMNLLADFRNYQFTIPMIPGVFIHMEDKNTTVNFPRNTYEKVMKVLSNSNDHVLALASNFSSEADSHLVCIQNEDGNYQTQAINIQNTPRRVTGSSFIVFSGALKASTGLTAKSSIVEDGLLVQIPSDTMSDLKNALRDMKDFTIGCGLSNAQQPEVILLQWTKDDKSFNIGVRSPIDNRSLEGIQSIRIHTGTDYAGEYHLIRWTEVFFLQMDESGNRQQTEPADPSRLAEAVAQACCQALTPHLEWLAEAELNKIGLRVTLDADKVGYDIGAAGEPLPSMYMNALDSALIPVITCASTSNHENPIVLELIFHVLLK